MKLLKYVFFLYIINISLPLTGQEDDIKALEDFKKYLIECSNATKATMQSIYAGESNSGNPYDLSVIKYKKKWIVVVVDSSNFDTYSWSEEDGLNPHSVFLNNNIGKIINAKYLKFKKSKKPVPLQKDLEFRNYYVFNRHGKNFYKHAKSIEDGKPKYCFLGWLLAPFSNLFNKKLPTNLQAPKSPCDELAGKVATLQAKMEEKDIQIAELQKNKNNSNTGVPKNLPPVNKEIPKDSTENNIANPNKEIPKDSTENNITNPNKEIPKDSTENNITNPNKEIPKDSTENNITNPNKEITKDSTENNITNPNKETPKDSTENNITNPNKEITKDSTKVDITKAKNKNSGGSKNIITKTKQALEETIRLIKEIEESSLDEAEKEEQLASLREQKASLEAKLNKESRRSNNKVKGNSGQNSQKKAEDALQELRILIKEIEESNLNSDEKKEKLEKLREQEKELEGKLEAK